MGGTLPESRWWKRIAQSGIALLAIAAACALPLSAETSPIQATPQMARAQTASAQTAPAQTTFPQTALNDLAPPIAPDRAQQLHEELVKLSTTARIMQVVAHPDDEDGALLTLEARGHGVSTVLMTLTRGEGGQNKEGDTFFDELGILRTLELLAADKTYGAEERFSSVADFGFSKTASETFEKWGGHDRALADIVRVIRTYQPDVLVTRFSGTPRDGHGNHQAAGILTIEAFTAAADPTKFPEQIREGLPPWQTKKLYVGNVGDAATLKLDMNAVNPILGQAPLQIAWQGLKHQLSQGAGSWTMPTGAWYASYELRQVAPGISKPSSEKDMFDGLDTSLPGLASRLGAEADSVPNLRGRLEALANYINEAAVSAKQNPDDAAGPLLAGLKAAVRLQSEVTLSQLPDTQRRWLMLELSAKIRQFNTASKLALGLDVEVHAERPGISDPFIVPGEQLNLVATIRNQGSRPVEFLPMSADRHPALLGPVVMEPVVKIPRQILPGTEIRLRIRAKVREDAAPTRAYFHRDSPVLDSLYQIDDPSLATLPLPDASIFLDLPFQVDGAIPVFKVPVLGSQGDGDNPPRALFVTNDFSLNLTPNVLVLRGQQRTPITVEAALKNFTSAKQAGTLTLHLPAGWRAQPPTKSITFSERGQVETASFLLYPEARSTQKLTQITATFEAAGKSSTEGVTLIERPDLDAFPYYQTAEDLVSVVNVQLPERRRIGYIMGAGDDIPEVLRDLGFEVTLISPEELASGKLQTYDTIVLGIRAYDVREDLRKNNKRLLQYAAAGGTLVVQYNQNFEGFNQGQYMPYPATLSRQRVSVEGAPVTLLEPQEELFHYPNTIAPTDFDGWVQERGLYFMSEWDPHYTALLSCHDPDEASQNGGLLRARVGKGTYIYTGYAFFRQLPNGVPGAVRLFVNLLSAGHSPTEQPVVNAMERAR